LGLLPAFASPLSEAEAHDDEVRAAFRDGRFAEAEAHARESLALREGAVASGEDARAKVGKSLFMIGAALRWQGEYEAAKPPLLRSIEILREALGPEHAAVAQSIDQLAVVAVEESEFDTARSLFEEALEIRRKAQGANHPSVAKSLHGLADLHHRRGDLDAAWVLYEECVAILREGGDSARNDLAAILSQMGALLQAQGDYRAARPLFEEAVDLMAEASSPRHPNVAAALGNLARLLRAQGDLEAARALYERSLDIMRETLGDGHPKVATALNNTATVYIALGDPEAATPLLEQALAIRRERLGPKHPDVAVSLANLASTFSAQDDRERARALAEEALAINREVFGGKHATVAGNLQTLAQFAMAAEAFERADQLLHASLAIDRELLGHDHKQVASSMALLGRLRHKLGDDDGARRAFDESLTIAESRLALLDVLSEREALLWLSENRRYLDGYLGAHDDPAFAAANWTHTLRWKGILGARVRASRLAARADPRTAEALESLAAVRRDLARLAFAESGLDQETRRRDMATLAASAEVLERGIMSSDTHTPREVTPAALCEALPPRTALVDFLRTTGDDSRYLAFAITAGECVVHQLQLGSAAELEAAVAEWRQTLVDSESLDKRVQTRGEAVSQRLWDPIRAVIPKAEKVLFVPDGSIVGVPFAALPVGDGRFLMEDLHIAYLDRASDALQPAVDGAANGALVVGGVDFDVAVDAEAPEIRSALAPCVESFEPLPGTDREVDVIVDRWRRARKRDPILALRGSAATELAVSEALKGKAVAHLATHGFFATGAGCHSVLEGSGGVGYDPLLLSGLALAGANRPADAFASQDGILTAAEVAALDLSGTQLVVLSACNTGIGEITSGEGVLGLRRAFATAGVRSLVMTLWSVGDEDAERLMADFYDGVLKRKALSPSGALRAAQLAALRRNRVDGGQAKPGTWAAWVASGSHW